MAPLAELRAKRGLSRERLAALAGLSARTIFGIERENVRPQRATAHVLAEVLGCEPDDLLDGEAPASTPGLRKASAGQGRHDAA
jgi:transcriptional regulator with XRE-family HTH domain